MPTGYAAYCLKGHLVGRVDAPATPSQLRAWAARESIGGARFSEFCIECGSPTLSYCPHCQKRIAPGSKYCGGCHKPFPWTEDALSAAKEFTDELDSLSPEEKIELKSTFNDLTVDSARTQLAMSRFQKYMKKLGPTVGSAFQKILETVVVEVVKKGMSS